MILIPSHLKDFVKVDKTTKDSLYLKVLCSCGCSEFSLLINEIGDAEEKFIHSAEKRICSWGQIQNYTDPKTQIRYFVNRNFLGRIVDKIRVEDLKTMKRIHILKSKCHNCEKEFILFDNRKYGYDAILNGHQENNEDRIFNFYELQKSVCQIKIKIINDLSYSEFIEEKVNGTLEEFSNAYTNIEIFSCIEHKKKKVFEEETA